MNLKIIQIPLFLCFFKFLPPASLNAFWCIQKRPNDNVKMLAFDHKCNVKVHGVISIPMIRKIV